MTTALRTAFFTTGFLALAACAEAQPQPLAPASTGQPTAADQQAGLPPTDASLLGTLPIPMGAKIMADQSVIIGSGDSWVGRLALNVGRDVPAVYQYFLDGFKSQGWTLQSAVRSKESLLVFTRSGRSATIEFQETPKLVGGVLVTVTMAPQGSVSRY
jgi:hypothetical protein